MWEIIQNSTEDQLLCDFEEENEETLIFLKAKLS